MKKYLVEEYGENVEAYCISVEEFKKRIQALFSLEEWEITYFHFCRPKIELRLAKKESFEKKGEVVFFNGKSETAFVPFEKVMNSFGINEEITEISYARKTKNGFVSDYGAFFISNKGTHIFFKTGKQISWKVKEIIEVKNGIN